MYRSLTFLLFLLYCLTAQAQDYLDIIKISANNATLGNAASDFETNSTNLNAELYYPTRINEELVLLTGFTVENTSLALFDGADRGNLVMTRLNLGIKYQFSEKWAGTYVVLPKLASDFKTIGGDDFQLGGLALMEYQYTPAWKVKFGGYVSSENFGTTLTPLIGFWHRSKNQKFYINATLPVRLDANYAITDGFSVGADWLTSIKSYHLSGSASDSYVQEESIRFALYGAIGFMENSWILRGKIGYDTTDYGLYASNDLLGGQVLTFSLAEDTRNRRNAEFEGALFLGLDLLYRFDLNKEQAN